MCMRARSWTPLFVPSGAVVVDVGAALSHAIIVSRELGIPCVISATQATEKIPDGAMIKVNGDTGVVTILSLESATYTHLPRPSASPLLPSLSPLPYLRDH